SPNAMLLYDENHIVTLINRSACAIAGVEESYAGQSALELPVFGEVIAQAGPNSFVPGEVTAENRIIRLGETSGKTHSYRYTMHQVILYGKVSGILLTVQDITKEEQAQQAAFEEEKSRALTRIAAGIAHEIRNPLMSIRTFATLIGAKGDDRQVQQSFAHYVPSEVDRINKLIEHLIHYTKPSKRIVSSIHMSKLLDECLYLVGPLINKDHMVLHTQIDSSICLEADRDQIKQIMINLMMNSIEAMARKLAQAPQNTPLNLHVILDKDREYTRIVVRDEGTGMSPARLHQCRDPFYSTKENGTGMGLALCEQYVKENRGLMQIESVEEEYTEISLLFRS
ncbi:hypothetical protein LJC42_07015, partial [Eubacteriales bacterium OttesenSCG-928-K08]|nr:hypothetical protein [Eubacteriales bacterium OttesenSCG-928-K08]